MTASPFAPHLAILATAAPSARRMSFAIESPEERAEAWRAGLSRAAAERAAAGPLAVAVAKVCPLLGALCQGELCAAWVKTSVEEGYCAHFAALRSQVRGK